MSVSFGFSAGDFIASIEIVATVIDALQESGDVSAGCGEIVRPLQTLETALLHVKRLDLDPKQSAEVTALQLAAVQCQRTIDEFWEKISEYQPQLRAEGSSSRLKDGWMNIKWAVCKEEDVEKFKTDLVAQTESLQLLLATLQMDSMNIHEKRHEHQSDSTSPSKIPPAMSSPESFNPGVKRSPTQSQQMKTSLNPQILENRFIDPERLKATLDKLFGRNYSVRYKRGRWILKVPISLTEEQIEDIYIPCT